ncbi:MAG: 50S ribosomal protein L13 [Bacteroidia bacterium]|nr:50S ribosomal protein L13 [Bacteroidia bacterium]MDW8157575.1 50S ribosomal protein L13 [Bacteroidia bacterium]
MDSLSYKTKFISHKQVKRDWLLIDATNLELGRLASRIAFLLRGKHKPFFTPHVNCGDKVVVVNAEKVKLSGSKFYKKTYLTHSGYPGGQKARTPQQIASKEPERLIYEAVRGMLPKNRLGRAMFKNLKVYKGDNHPHAAQNPQVFVPLIK